MNLQKRWQFIVDKLHIQKIQTLASSMAFVTALSIMPLVAISLSIFQALGGLEKLFPLVKGQIFQFFSLALSEKILSQFQTLVDQFNPKSIGITGFLMLTFTAVKLISDIDHSIQTIWGLQNRSSLIKRLLIYWMILFLLPITVAVVVGLLTSTYLTQWVSFPFNITFLSLITLSLFVIYKFVPRTQVKSSVALFSAAMTTLFFKLSQMAYFSVIGRLINYNKLYGSLAFIPTFLLWILIIWYIFLMGTALCASLTQRPVLASQKEES